jgi:hypothetical protein
MVWLGIGLVASGLARAPWGPWPWHRSLTGGVLVGAAAARALGYTGHALFLSHWFVGDAGSPWNWHVPGRSGLLSAVAMRCAAPR